MYIAVKWLLSAIFFCVCVDIIQKPLICVFVLSEETHLVASALDRRQSLKLQKRIARAKANEDLEELEVIFVLFSF